MTDLLYYLNTHGGLSADSMRCAHRAGALTTYTAVPINVLYQQWIKRLRGAYVQEQIPSALRRVSASFSLLFWLSSTEGNFNISMQATPPS